MIYPSKSTYLQLSEEGVFFPFIKTLRISSDPVELYSSLKRQSNDLSVLLESSRVCEPIGRYSFVLTKPFMRFRSKGTNCIVTKDNEDEFIKQDPFGLLRCIFKDFRLVREESLPPFVGGLAGLFGYELKNQIEVFDNKLYDPYNVYDVDAGFFDRGVIYDHKENMVMAFHLNRSASGKRDYEKGLEGLSDWAREIYSLDIFSIDEFQTSLTLDHSIFAANRGSFEDSVNTAKAYIRKGDIFQANLSHCIEMPNPGNLIELYNKQRSLNPTAFAAFLDFGDYQILSGSPERLVSLNGKSASTRPIAGTRPRSASRDLDNFYSLDLLLSPKERAEHVMLIDLERNDLGRVSEYGSVKVDQMMTIENYSHVRHIVSNISSRLLDDKDVFDLIKSVFPGGTITGAPKIRSMEIIDELERRVRGPYTGSIGYIGFDGNCDLNIVIRTLFVKEAKSYLQVGAGIVADSDPKNEYRETIDKAKAFLQVLEGRKGPSKRRSFSEIF